MLKPDWLFAKEQKPVLHLSFDQNTLFTSYRTHHTIIAVYQDLPDRTVQIDRVTINIVNIILKTKLAVLGRCELSVSAPACGIISHELKLASDLFVNCNDLISNIAHSRQLNKGMLNDIVAISHIGYMPLFQTP